MFHPISSDHASNSRLNKIGEGIDALEIVTIISLLVRKERK